MPASDALDSAIARLAKKAKSPEEVVLLADAYDKLRHAGERLAEQSDFAASGADMLDASANFAEPDDRAKRVGFRPQRPLAY